MTGSRRAGQAAFYTSGVLLSLLFAFPLGLFAFLASWNDFFAPLILLSDGDKFTLPVAVVAMRERSFGAIDYGALEAGVMVMALPCVILFLVLQRHYVQGFTTGALRG